MLCAYLNGIYFEFTDKNETIGKQKLRFNGFNTVSYCHAHSLKRNHERQIYYRRYAINFENTSNFHSFDDFKKEDHKAKFMNRLLLFYYGKKIFLIGY